MRSSLTLSARRASRVWRLLLALTLGAAVVGITPSTAGADPALEGSANGHGVSATIGSEDLIPPTPEASSTVGEDDDTQEALLDIPADPLAVSGTAVATAAAHVDADITSALQVNTQGVEGPYNAQGVGQIEDAVVGVDVAGEGVPLLEADVIRAEAVAVCSGETVTYSANSEIVNLDLGGEDVPLNEPLEEIINGVNEALAESGLFEIVNVEYNVVNSTADGVTVDALRLTVLDAADDAEIVVNLGHAEVSGVTCGEAAPPPECSDGEDNDGDGRVDIDDPMCHTDNDADNPDSYDPNDDDEGGDPECVDGIDNDDPEDELADADDPGCHTDGDASNPDSFDPTDDDETDPALPREDEGGGEPQLARTGGSTPLVLVTVLAVLGLATRYLFRLRSV